MKSRISVLKKIALSLHGSKGGCGRDVLLGARGRQGAGWTTAKHTLSFGTETNRFKSAMVFSSRTYSI